MNTHTGIRFRLHPLQRTWAHLHEPAGKRSNELHNPLRHGLPQFAMLRGFEMDAIQVT